MEDLLQVYLATPGLPMDHVKNNEASQKSTFLGHLLFTVVFYTVLGIFPGKSTSMDWDPRKGGNLRILKT